MKPSSTTPYFLRALYEWCLDNGFTPHIVAAVDEATKVPQEYVKDGQIVLNIGPAATRNLTIDNDWVRFSARFGGVSREVAVPIRAVAGIFARENGQGMKFQREEAGGAVEAEQPAEAGDGRPQDTPPRGKPRLQVVK
jgi:stringent starvation protein B